ncbi:MAG: membrane protein insertase YidC [Anaerolineae bacterium]|nr:membrane protein insertase YidC [Anaerolineae bacterium]
MKSLRLLILPLIVVGLILFLALFKPATAAFPNPSPTTLNPIAQANGVTLEKKASSETVPLGQVVTYTVTVKNGSNRDIDFTLTDVMPKGLSLALQTHSISVTLGTFDNHNNTVTWSGSLPQNQAATIIYHAIPPSTAEPGETLNNVAQLKFGETTLEASATVKTTPQELGIWGSFVNFIALSLVYLDNVLKGWGLPYAFGFSIILFTILVRVATFPLNMQQIKSSKAMQELQPRMKELQEKYKNDREKLAQEQMALYKEAGVNPLGGCLPTLVQMPIWFALYQALTQLSHEGLLYEGFLWIPSLAGPVADRGGGLNWLWPLPPSIGWGPALAYLVLPVLLVVSQYYMQQMMTPPNPDPQQASMNSMMKIMPIMFGYFSLIVPSGLTLYWFTSNLLALIQQYFTQTNMKPATAPTGTRLSAPVTASSPVAANPEENSKDTHVKSKRKSRRKR